MQDAENQACSFIEFASSAEWQSEAEPKTKKTKAKEKNMTTKSIDVMVGKKAEKPSDPKKIGKGVAAKPAEPEVGGRDTYYRWAEFPCGHVCQILYDTDAYHTYECAWGDSWATF